MKFWKKELFSTPTKLPDGRRVPFVEVADDVGVLATEDGFLNGELDKLASRHVGGVVEIDQATYEDLKKNPPSKPSLPAWFAGQQNRISRRADARNANLGVIRPPPRDSAPLTVPQSIPPPASLTAAETAPTTIRLSRRNTDQ